MVVSTKKNGLEKTFTDKNHPGKQHVSQIKFKQKTVKHKSKSKL
jgi:hypothetical protein